MKNYFTGGAYARVRMVALSAVAAFLAAALSAQTTGSITGRVTDPNGSVTANAAVMVTNAGTKSMQKVNTNGDGIYFFYDLLVGTYDVTVTANGFKSVVKSEIQLNVGDKLAVNFQLELGRVSETVNVTDATPLVNTETADISDTITTQQMTDLPVNGRAFTQIQQLVPGASRTMGDEGGTGFNSSRGFALNGQQEQATGFQVDGVENTDMGNGTGMLTSPGLEAIGEMKVNATDYSAEYGNAAGASLLVVTRTGTEQFHGAAYEFFKNDALDAVNYFSRSNQKLRYNDYGYRLGGPFFIPGLYPRKQSKTFFFFAQEWKRNNATDIFVAATPTDAMRSGNFSAEDARTGKHIIDPTTGQPFLNDQIDPSRIDPNAALLLKSNFPEPTPGLTGFQNFNQNAPDTDTWRQELLNVTHDVTNNIRVQVRYIEDTEVHHLSGVLWSGQAFPNIQTTTNLPGHSFLAKVSQVLSPTTLNEVSYDYASNYGSKSQNAVSESGAYLAPTGLTISPLFPQTGVIKIPNLGFSGGWGNIDTSYYPWWAHHNVQEANDNFSKSAGRHSLRLGAIYEHSVTPVGAQVDPGTQGGFNFTGYATGDPMADFLLGDFASYTQLETSLMPSYNYNHLEAYFQDTWKVTPKLTLNLGIRYFYIPHLYIADNSLYNFVPARYDPTQAVTVNPDGTILPNSGNRYNGLISPKQGLPTDLVGNNPWKFGPRFGFAFDPSGKGLWAVRGGYGMGYYRVQGNDSYGLVGNPPNGNIGTRYNGPLDNPSAGAAGSLSPFAVTSLNEIYPTPVVESWSIDIQHQLAEKTSASVGYVGTFGTHSDSVRNINQPMPYGGYDFNPGLNDGSVVYSTIVQYKGFTSINQHVPGGTTAYHGLQAHVQRQLTHGLMAEASYTFSKAMSNSTNFGATPQDSYHPLKEWSLASYDRPHMLIANYMYQLPSIARNHGLVARSVLDGWQWTGVVQFQSGTPLTVELGTGTQGLATRPNLQSGQHEKVLKKQDQWFDPNVYVAPVPGYFGTLKPYSLRGPGITGWDTALFKTIDLGEHLKYSIRCDAFNVLNHPSWSGLNQTFAGLDNNGTAINNGIGQITSAHDPRILQLNMKLEF